MNDTRVTRVRSAVVAPRVPSRRVAVVAARALVAADKKRGVTSRADVVKLAESDPNTP